MDSVLASFDATLVPQLLRFVFLYSLLDVCINRLGRHPETQRSILWVLLISSTVVLLLGRIWLSFVTAHVPEPYLVGHPSDPLGEGDGKWLMSNIGRGISYTPGPEILSRHYSLGR